MDQDELDIMNDLIQNKSYRAVSKISQGSYGQVYTVIGSDKKQYALKIIDRKKLIKVSKQHQGIIQGLVLKKLIHPGIITLYDSTVRQDWIHYVMELCPFGDINYFMNKINNNLALFKLKPKILKYYLTQIINTIDYMHSRGVIHRDIKPENIVIGPDFKIRFIDFGSAKALHENFYTTQQRQMISKARSSASEQFRTKSFVGSPHYISPEGTTCEYQYASDIWSFGVLVYRLFHGKLPFEGQNNYLLFQKIKEAQYELDETIPIQAKQIIVICLKKDPKDRPSTKFLRSLTLLKDYKDQYNFTYDVFTIDLPFKIEDLKIDNQKTDQQQVKLDITVQKKMLFGNYKPRIITITVKKDKLYMAYKYTDTKIVKNQFQLYISSYALVTNNDKQQFQVLSQSGKYQFRSKKLPAQEIVDQINLIIQNHFKIQ